MFRPFAMFACVLFAGSGWVAPVMAQGNAPPLAGALAHLEKFPPPQRRVGFVSPLPISNTVPYMFYGAFRQGVMLVEGSLALRGYDTASARAALGELDHTLAGVKN